MKKLLLTMGLAAISAIGFSQEKVQTYQMTYFDEVEFDISATMNGDEVKHYISMYSMEGNHRPVVLMIGGGDELFDFFDNLKEARNTYAKWDSISVENGVVDLNKQMSIKSKRFQAAFMYSDWYFDYSVPLSYTFKHIDGTATLLIRTGELNTPSNQYIDSDGGIFVFSSLEEIDMFIEALQPSHVVEYFKNKANTDTLFED